jgi:hypothetical protein
MMSHFAFSTPSRFAFSLNFEPMFGVVIDKAMVKAIGSFADSKRHAKLRSLTQGRCFRTTPNEDP